MLKYVNSGKLSKMDGSASQMHLVIDFIKAKESFLHTLRQQLWLNQHTQRVICYQLSRLLVVSCPIILWSRLLGRMLYQLHLQKLESQLQVLSGQHNKLYLNSKKLVKIFPGNVATLTLTAFVVVKAGIIEYLDT